MGILAVSSPLTTVISTTNGNTILHRSSPWIMRPSLSVPVSRADSENISGCSHPKLHSPCLSSFSFHFISNLQTNQGNHALAPPQKHDTASNVSAARSGIRSVVSMLYFLCHRARSVLHRQVGETVESLALASLVFDTSSVNKGKQWTGQTPCSSSIYIRIQLPYWWSYWTKGFGWVPKKPHIPLSCG